ncbi:hypothetical protein E3N88_04166 [Mikania micrantha]|uniref:X8 domain-containing protein n=1 Tax=Mikania micrantha TaxID=192012 RepID=A0A5N6PVU7_9ASTR|nr:hypothetical protein E3N88_04166 [Mikania micrantha]
MKSHTHFFSSLKQVEKRLKLDDGNPPSSPPPTPPPSQPPLLQPRQTETQPPESSISSPIDFHHQHTNTSSTLHDNSIEQPPQEFLSINDINEFESNPYKNPPQFSNSETNFSIVGDIDSMIQLLRLSDSERKPPEMPDVADDEFYDKIVKVKGPKCKKEVERLDNWMNYLMNKGRQEEPLRLAHLLMAKAAFVTGGLEFPSTVDEFLQNDPPLDKINYEASRQALQAALDYACGAGADSVPIQPPGLCFLPSMIQAHASYAFNSYYMRRSMALGSCDFAGTSTIVKTNPKLSSAGLRVDFRSREQPLAAGQFKARSRRSIREDEVDLGWQKRNRPGKDWREAIRVRSNLCDSDWERLNVGLIGSCERFNPRRRTSLIPSDVEGVCSGRDETAQFGFGSCEIFNRGCLGVVKTLIGVNSIGLGSKSSLEAVKADWVHLEGWNKLGGAVKASTVLYLTRDRFERGWGAVIV